MTRLWGDFCFRQLAGREVVLPLLMDWEHDKELYKKRDEIERSFRRI